ncbi:MAG: ATP-dependent metallopeptidase FtsH/Yme1/Tma family protein, partial [Holosporaceae bacterium]|nr:ATP-dependent metallopeptidase FtsH/Yme1/Tma family protein [Holosporaceae bacterium]
MGKNYKNLSIWIAIGCFVFLMFQAFNNGRENVTDITYSDFLIDVDNGKVSSVIIRGSAIDGITSDGRLFATYDPHDPELIKKLIAKNVKIMAGPGEEHS